MTVHGSLRCVSVQLEGCSNITVYVGTGLHVALALLHARMLYWESGWLPATRSMGRVAMHQDGRPYCAARRRRRRGPKWRSFRVRHCLRESDSTRNFVGWQRRQMQLRGLRQMMEVCLAVSDLR